MILSHGKRALSHAINSWARQFTSLISTVLNVNSDMPKMLEE